jgi:hypothetical protein
VTSLFDAVLATPGASADLIDRDGSAIAALKHWAGERGLKVEPSGNVFRVRVGIVIRITVHDSKAWTSERAANDESAMWSPAQGGVK